MENSSKRPKKSFKTSLKEGNKGQAYFTSILDNLGIKWEDSNDIHYDILTLNPVLSWEVKYDIYAAKSGNIAIEYWNSRKNKPSGLNATTATYWIHVLGENEILIAKTLDLRNVCANIEPHRKIFGGGDGNADLLLYKKETLYPSIFSLLTKDNFYELVS